jgi:acetoacetyl-CoA synthetase
MAKTPAAELLIPLWQKVLQRSSIQLTDNFFALGGGPASAHQLFAEIAAVFGRHLPSVLIYSVPTIQSLAGVLEQSSAPRVPPLLLLKAGTEQPPIFIAHGLGDTVSDLFPLAQRIESAHPVYGMQARGIDGVEEPFTSVEAMAQFHLDAIQRLQPHGPYFLIGYSLGGLVALEIAQCLSAGGEQIALLALVDSYPHRNQLGPVQFVRLSLRLTKRRVWSPGTPIPDRTKSEVLHPGNRNDPCANPSMSISSVTNRMRDAAYLALKGYRPQFYPGKIKFVRAEISTEFPYDPAKVWAHLADQFEVETIPGDHWSMLTTQFYKLGSVLTSFLHQVSV